MSICRKCKRFAAEGMAQVWHQWLPQLDYRRAVGCEGLKGFKE